MYISRALAILTVLLFTSFTVHGQDAESTTTSEPETTLKPEPTEETTTILISTTTTTTTTTTTISPVPKVPTYVVENEGKVCIRFQTIPSLTINYYEKPNNTSVSKEFDLKDKHLSATGKCNDNETYINLGWKPEGGSSMWNLTIEFGKIPEADIYGAKNVQLIYYLDEGVFPNANATGAVDASAKGDFFKAKVGNYYTCSAKETLNLKGSENKTSGVLIATQDTKIEAFAPPSKEPGFVGNAEPCSTDSKTSSLVPILVGVALAIMILVALVVFLIGSRRRAAAYESI